MSPVRTKSKPATRVKEKSGKMPPRNLTAGSAVRTKAAKTHGAQNSGLALGPLADFIGYPLRRAQIAVFDDFMIAAGRTGLRPGQFSTLVVIGANPGSKQTDVAEALGIQGPNFVTMINQLESSGFVQRRAFDRRAYALYLTLAGQALVDKSMRMQQAREAVYDAILGPGGHLLLLGLLARLMAGLEADKTGKA